MCFFNNCLWTDKTAVVMVLVEGDLSAIEHVKLAVENNIPVVIIEGTGGAADLLTECRWQKYKSISLYTGILIKIPQL